MATAEMIDLLVRTYQHELLCYARMLLRDPDAAQDAVQHAFVALARRPLDGLDNPRAWLYRVVRNDCLRQKRKKARVTYMERIPESPEEAVPPADHELAAHDDRQVLREAVDKLRDNWKEVVILKFQEHLSYKEIAALTGLSVSHVGVILHDALLELRRNCRKELIS